MAAASSYTLPNPYQKDVPFIFVTLSNVNPLTQINYINWELQVESILEGFDLFKYPDGSYPAPPKEVPNSADPPVLEPNPEYQTWKRQDKLVFGAILPTLSESVASLVTQTRTSAELWSLLKKTFARASRGHKKQLKDRLRSITKGTSTVTEFMNQLKTVSDILASIGAPVAEEDLTDYVLRGLDDSYQAVIDGVNARDTPIAFEELHEKLLNRELAIKTAARLTPAPVTALAAQSHAPAPYRPPSSVQQWVPQNPSGGQPQYQQGNRGNNGKKPYLGKCQFCQRIGHLLYQCRSFKQANPNVHIPAPPPRNQPRPPQAHTAAATAPSSQYLVDSGATHHITSSLEDLALYQPYTGPDSLFIGDGSARSLGLPLLNPYLNKSANFKHGVNFAVGGSTALDPAVLAQMNITSFTATNSSLSVQLDWFKAHLDSSCSSSTTTSTVEECRKKKLRKALILMGEIGGNDYNYPLFQDTKTIQQLYPLVPYVIAAIKNAVQELIDLGATNLLVPGNFPIGCAPVYLAEYQSNDTTAYDELKCLKDFNNLASLHNHRLQQALLELRLHNPSASIHYGDYYNSYVWVLREAALLGFEEDWVLKACCGKGDNEYNCDLKEQCGAKGVPVCRHPAKRLSWDGSHLTQHAYKHIADWLMFDIFGLPTCPTCSNLYVQER